MTRRRALAFYNRQAVLRRRLSTEEAADLRRWERIFLREGTIERVKEQRLGHTVTVLRATPGKKMSE